MADATSLLPQFPRGIFSFCGDTQHHRNTSAVSYGCVPCECARLLLMKALQRSGARPCHEASVERVQRNPTTGVIEADDDPVPSTARYFLPEEQKLKLGKFVPGPPPPKTTTADSSSKNGGQPRLMSPRKGCEPLLQQHQMKAGGHFTLSSINDGGNDHASDHHNIDDDDGDDDDDMLLMREKFVPTPLATASAAAVSSLPPRILPPTYIELTLGGNLFSSFFSGAIVFPVHYALKEKPHPRRGTSRDINRRVHGRDAPSATYAHHHLRVQSDNANKLALYKIGPGAVAFKVVVNAFEAGGMRYTHGDDWNVLWARRVDDATITAFHCYQRVNHFPGSSGIGRKDRLHENISKMISLFGDAHFDLTPRTFMYPSECRALEADAFAFQLRASNSSSATALSEFNTSTNVGVAASTAALPTYIVKPGASSCGKGIRLVKGISSIPRLLSQGGVGTSGKSIIVQRYIGSPLLVDGRKFDLRLYAVMTGVEPLRIFLFDQGLVRFAAEKYPGPDADLDNTFMHLTNYAVNKSLQIERERDKMDDDSAAIKWLLTDLMAWFKTNFSGGDNSGERRWNHILAQINGIIVKLMLTIESDVVSNLKKLRGGRGIPTEGCFELYGLDVLVDEGMRVHLLEVNIMPSLATGTAIDKACKGRLLSAILSLIGVVPFTRSAAASNGTDRGTTTAARTATTANMRYPPPSVQSGIGVLHPPLLQGLDCFSAAELIMAAQCDEELRRAELSGFRRVFPTASSAEKYFGLFKSGVSRANFVLASWEATKERLHTTAPPAAAV